MTRFAARSFSITVVAALGLVACAVDSDVEGVAGTSDALNKARIGPRSAPQSINRFDGQKGAIWELASGDILTSFDIGSAWTHRFSLRTIQGTTVTATPDIATGECIDHSAGYYGCRVGPGGAGTEPASWFSRRSFNSVYYDDADVEDRAVLLTEGLYLAGATYEAGPPIRSGPGISRLDPATGTTSVVMTVNDAFGSGVLPRETYYRLRELPGEQLAFSYIGMVDSGPQPVPQTLVLAKDGTVVHQHEGWLVESRPGTAELLLSLTTVNVWWDAASNATRPAPDVPSTVNLHIARNGDIVSLSQTEIGYFSHDGSIAQRKPVDWAAVSVLGVLPDGGYISQESDTNGEVIRLNDPRKTPSVVQLSSRASIVAETGWTLGASSFELPTYEGAGTAVVDDEGNSYISYHRRVNDGYYDSYVVSFDSKGRRRWGAVASDSWSRCYPWTALSGSRLALRCASAYSGSMVLLGP